MRAPGRRGCHGRPSRCSAPTRRRSVRGRRPGQGRARCGVPIKDRVFSALAVFMGSAYVNDFNLLGRTFQVNAQADNQLSADLAAMSRT